jgi:hypothetical protein
MSAIAEQDWMPITDGNSYEISPAWAPDRNVLYFYSERDGFRCIWAQRLHSATKHPVGPPFEIQDFHTATRNLTHLTKNWLGLSAGRNKLVFNVGEIAGNVWMLKFQQRR